jgi:hypothetical protein
LGDGLPRKLRSSVRVESTPARRLAALLLDHVGELVADQTFAISRPRAVLAGREIEVPTDGRCPGAEAVGQPLGLGVIVDADVREVVVEEARRTVRGRFRQPRDTRR